MSHNTMGAFFSSTDNSDDQSGIRFSGVVGQLDKPQFQTVWRFNYKTAKVDVKFEDIFEAEPEPEIEVPEEWMSNVKTLVNTAPYARGHGGIYAGGGFDDEGYWETYYSTQPGFPHRGGGAVTRGPSHAQPGATGEYARQQGGAQVGKPQGAGGVENRSGLWNQTIGASKPETNAGAHNLGKSAAASAEVFAASGLVDVEGNPLSQGQRGEFAFLNELDSDPVDEIDEAPVPTGKGSRIISMLDVPDGVDPQEFGATVVAYGEDAAHTYHNFINELTFLEDCDDLLVKAVEECVGMMKSDEEKAKLLYSIFQQLDSKQQNRIMQNGL